MSSSPEIAAATKSDVVHLEMSEDVHVNKLLENGKDLAATECDLGLAATFWQQWRPALVATVGFSSGLVFGYDTVVNGASVSMPSFLLYFGTIGENGAYLPSIWTSLWTAMSALMQALGAIAAGYIIDKFGRKWPSTAAACLTLVGTAVQYTAVARPALMGGKMISGVGIGALMASGTTYIGEVAPLKLKAPIQTGLVIFVLLTQALALGVVRSLVPRTDEGAFRTVFAIQWAVGTIAAVSWALVPESPIWLAMQGRNAAALASMRLIYGPNNSPSERLSYMKYEIQLERQTDTTNETDNISYLACFRKHHLRRTFTVTLIYSTSNIAGAAFLSQNIYFLITVGLGAVHAFDVGIGGFALAIILIAAGSTISKHISRRNTVLIALVFNTCTLVVIGGLHWATGTAGLWAIAILMNILISIQSCALQGAGWPIAAEIPSHHLRAMTLSIGVFAQTFSTWLVTFVTPYLYNVDSGNLGAKTGFVYAGLSLVTLALVWLYVPDVTGMRAEDIDGAYEAGVTARKIREYVAFAENQGHDT